MRYETIAERLPDSIGQQLQGSLLPEYRLDEGDIREHDSLAELRQTYADNGVELDGIEETYEKAKQDWWDDTRRPVGRTDEPLPGDTVRLRYEDDGEQVTGEIHVRGLVHGLHGVINVSEDLEERTRQSIEELAAPDRQVLLEENFAATLYEGVDADPDIREMDDHDVLAEHSLHPVYTAVRERLREHMQDAVDDNDIEPGPATDHDPREGRLAQAGELYKSIVRLSGRLSRDPDTRKHAASMRAIDDPGYLRDMQNAARAGDLPHQLKADYMDHMLGQDREQQLTALGEIVDDGMDLGEAVRTLYSDVMAPEATARFRELWELVEIGRSEYMAEEAVRALGGDDVEQVDLVVGAGHQAQIIDTIRAASDDRLRELLD